MAEGVEGVTTNLRQRLNMALDEAARWRQFAADTQAVNIHLQRALDRHAIGCPDCNYTGLVDAIDPQLDVYLGIEL